MSCVPMRPRESGTPREGHYAKIRDRGTSNYPLLPASLWGLKVLNAFVLPPQSFITANCIILVQYGQKIVTLKYFTESGGANILNKINRGFPKRINW